MFGTKKSDPKQPKAAKAGEGSAAAPLTIDDLWEPCEACGGTGHPIVNESVNTLAKYEDCKAPGCIRGQVFTAEGATPCPKCDGGRVKVAGTHQYAMVYPAQSASCTVCKGKRGKPTPAGEAVLQLMEKVNEAPYRGGVPQPWERAAR